MTTPNTSPLEEFIEDHKESAEFAAANPFYRDNWNNTPVIRLARALQSELQTIHKRLDALEAQKGGLQTVTLLHCDVCGGGHASKDHEYWSRSGQRIDANPKSHTYTNVEFKGEYGAGHP